MDDVLNEQTFPLLVVSEASLAQSLVVPRNKSGRNSRLWMGKE